MSQVLVLQNAITWAQAIITNQSLSVNGLEPGLTFGNWILQRIMGPPFRWRFNRKTFNIPISQGSGTDYTVAIADLGHIEGQWLQDNSGGIYELNGALWLPKSSLLTRPTEYAPVYDDNQGNITFRFKSLPDKVYTTYIDYQAKPGLMTSYAAPWGTVPDEFSYIFNAGFLSLAMMLIRDSRFPIWEQYFISALLGAQDGLDEQAVNIFMRDWINYSRSISRSMGETNSGLAGRAK